MDQNQDRKVWKTSWILLKFLFAFGRKCFSESFLFLLDFSLIHICPGYFQLTKILLEAILVIKNLIFFILILCKEINGLEGDIVMFYDQTII